MNLIQAAGRMTRERVDGAGYTLFVMARAMGYVGRLPRRLRFLLDQCFAAGVRALPVTLIVALFAGAILALQTGIELRRVGQTAFIGTVTSLSMCREMGPFMTALILAATVGSAMAAEIGTMKVSDEVTALEVMSVDPIDYLVTPRLVALTVMCPILTVFTDLVGIFGGAAVAQVHLGVSPIYYWTSVRDALFSPERLLPKDVYTGLVKAMVFGCTVAAVSCSAGLRASGGALGVGLAVQSAVRNSILLIIVLGFVLTWFFYFFLAS